MIAALFFLMFLRLVVQILGINQFISSAIILVIPVVLVVPVGLTLKSFEAFQVRPAV
jgi:hypothetical protein